MDIEIENTFRPKAAEGKIHFSDDFELCYLRHRYLRKVNRNPSEEEMAPYQRIIKWQAKTTYATCQNLFASVGLDDEDLISVGQVHLVSFLGLFAVEASEERRKKFVDLFLDQNAKLPTEKDILHRNCNTFRMFLKQRMEDTVRICGQKVKNVKGCPSDQYQIFFGPKKPGKDLDTLAKNYSRLGYKKMTLGSFRTVRRKSGEQNNIFKFEGLWYVCIPTRRKNLTLEDLVGADMSPLDAIHNMDPEQIILQIEENSAFETKKQEFDSLTPRARARVIKRFIRRNKKKGKFLGEIATAKKMLCLLEKECESTNPNS